MSTPTTSHRSAWAITATLAAVLVTAACTGNDGVAPSSAASSGTASETTAPSLTPSTTTTSVTSTTTPATTTAPPVPNNGIRPREPAEVSRALLDTSSFIAGIHVVPTPTSVTITSSNATCGPFVTGAGEKTGYAIIAFQDDIDPFPFLIEDITTVGNSGRVADFLAALDGSTPGCSKVTVKVPGAGSGTMTVSRVTPPAHGDHPTAVRVVGASGALRGLYLTLVATGVEDAVVQLTFIQATDSDINGVTADAVDQARKVFTYTKPS